MDWISFGVECVVNGITCDGGAIRNLANAQLKIGLAMDFALGDGVRRLGPSAEINVIYAWY